MLKPFQSQRGVTLVEILIVIAILSVVLAGVFNMYLLGTKIFVKGKSQFSAQHNVRMASFFITSEVRNAYNIEILATMPGTPDPQKKYIYIDGNTIKSSIGGFVTNILNETSTDFTPALTFTKNATNGKILNFSIQGTYKGQNFNVTSEVLPLNIDPADEIIVTSGDDVIAISCPMTDFEIVNVDRALLDLHGVNAFLVPEGDGSLTLPPPDPNLLALPLVGVNNSTISWASSDTARITNDGVVIRPGIGSGSIPVTLTATLSKGTQSVTKTFIVNVGYLDPLVLLDSTLTAASTGIPYSYNLTATGGDGAYSFTTTYNLALHGLSLGINGVLSGSNPSGPGFSFPVTVTDGFSIPNTITQVVDLPFN